MNHIPSTLAAVVPAACVVLSLAGCPGAQVRPASGAVDVVLRRIDVVEAGYDRMKLNVIVAIENGTGGDVPASAEATVAIVGEAPESDESDESEESGTSEDSGGAEGEADAAAGGEEAGEKDAAPAADDAKEDEGAAAGGGTPIDGQRHAGRGAGSAPAYNTSELPIAVELPLPSDPALLEQVLDWKKMLVHVEGNVKVGLETRRIGGSREVAPPHLPEVRLKEAQVASVDGGAAGTGFFTLLLDNKNPFPVTIDRLAWTITIKDKELKPSSGSTDAEKDSIPPSAVGEYQAEVQLDEAAFGKDLKTLLKNPTVPYVIEGALEVRGIKRPFKFEGDMKFAR